MNLCECLTSFSPAFSWGQFGDQAFQLRWFLCYIKRSYRREEMDHRLLFDNDLTFLAYWIPSAQCCEALPDCLERREDI